MSSPIEPEDVLESALSLSIGIDPANVLEAVYGLEPANDLEAVYGLESIL